MAMRRKKTMLFLRSFIYLAIIFISGNQANSLSLDINLNIDDATKQHNQDDNTDEGIKLNHDYAEYNELEESNGKEMGPSDYNWKNIISWAKNINNNMRDSTLSRKRANRSWFKKYITTPKPIYTRSPFYGHVFGRKGTSWGKDIAETSKDLFWNQLTSSRNQDTLRGVIRSWEQDIRGRQGSSWGVGGIPWHQDGLEKGNFMNKEQLNQGYSGHREAGHIGAGVRGSSGSNVFINAESLSDDKKSILLQALSKLQKLSIWDQVTAIHGKPLRTECNGGRSYCCIHNGDGGFLPWHRLYLSKMHKVLNNLNPQSALVYWDWTTIGFPSLAQYPNINDPKTGQLMKNPLYSGFKKYTGSFTRRKRRPIPPFSENLMFVLKALEEDDFRLFSEQLKAVHSTIHNRVGGDFSDLGDAAYDPIFFLHHTFVDLVWAVYQELKPLSKPSYDIMQQQIIPYPDSIFQTMDYKKLGYTYNLDINSDRIVFGGMTLRQIQRRISRLESKITFFDYAGIPQNKIFAGLFLKSFNTSGTIKFSLCNQHNCSYPGGQVDIFGGPYEMPYTNTDPTKVDVTDAIKKAAIPIPNIRFNVTEFEDVNGNKLPANISQPITIIRRANNGKDLYIIHLSKYYTQPQTIRVPPQTEYQIDSVYGNVLQTGNKKAYEKCNKSKSKYVPARKILHLKAGNYYYFDKDCNGSKEQGSKIKIIKE